MIVLGFAESDPGSFHLRLEGFGRATAHSRGGIARLSLRHTRLKSFGSRLQRSNVLSIYSAVLHRTATGSFWNSFSSLSNTLEVGSAIEPNRLIHLWIKAQCRCGEVT